jgi:hypothetical protein
MTQAQTPASQGYVLGATEGEHLVHWRDAGNIFIKVGPATGSDDLALGTQQVPVGVRYTDTFGWTKPSTFWKAAEFSHSTMHNTLLGRAERYSFPRMRGMGFANPDRELLLLWIMAPAGLDGFFRDTCSPPGVAPKQLTR